MVRKQRRMTVKKNSNKKRAPIGGPKSGRRPSAAKSPKGAVGRSSAKAKRPAANDRANTAFKALMKAMQNQTEDQE